MEVKITGSHDDLKALHVLFYEQDEDVEIDEDYGPIQGYQKEPVVTSLIIVTFGKMMITIINNYYKERLEKYKIDKKQETEIFKFFIKEQKKWKRKEIIELEEKLENSKSKKKQ